MKNKLITTTLLFIIILTTLLLAGCAKDDGSSSNSLTVKKFLSFFEKPGELVKDFEKEIQKDEPASGFVFLTKFVIALLIFAVLFGVGKFSPFLKEAEHKNIRIAIALIIAMITTLTLPFGTIKLVYLSSTFAFYAVVFGGIAFLLYWGAFAMRTDSRAYYVLKGALSIIAAISLFFSIQGFEPLTKSLGVKEVSSILSFVIGLIYVANWMLLVGYAFIWCLIIKMVEGPSGAVGEAVEELGEKTPDFFKKLWGETKKIERRTEYRTVNRALKEREEEKLIETMIEQTHLMKGEFEAIISRGSMSEQEFDEITGIVAKVGEATDKALTHLKELRRPSRREHKALGRMLKQLKKLNYDPQRLKALTDGILKKHEDTQKIITKFKKNYEKLRKMWVDLRTVVNNNNNNNLNWPLALADKLNNLTFLQFLKKLGKKCDKKLLPLLSQAEKNQAEIAKDTNGILATIKNLIEQAEEKEK